jgi:hypothetical protein
LGLHDGGQRQQQRHQHFETQFHITFSFPGKSPSNSFSMHPIILLW